MTCMVEMGPLPHAARQGTAAPGPPRAGDSSGVAPKGHTDEGRGMMLSAQVQFRGLPCHLPAYSHTALVPKAEGTGQIYPLSLTVPRVVTILRYTCYSWFERKHHY